METFKVIKKSFVCGMKKVRRLCHCCKPGKSSSPLPAAPVQSAASLPAPHSLLHSFVFLNSEELQKIPRMTSVGEGSYGVVEMVYYNGAIMVLKKHKKVTLEKFIEEHSFHVALDGAGGAPRVRAVCVEERAMIMDYTGMSYDQYLRRCSPREQFHSLLKVAEALSALHLKNVIHNDLKENNITITFPEGNPVLHIIDYGLATKSGVTVNHGQHYRYWKAPELYTGGLTSPASDTYSFG
ncbi:casein kinase 1-like protein 12 [Homarus americanus]|uniref:Membrane-associated tyrosine and threonine-specific cdc2-inhibitory kinase-like 1 n=1 Tax=Homarus americanus TaxID=6706 RepID=A0A8J5MW08_HOMAM|nr:casein kinase 1-like protein 12 [Homarus americanus]KAG7165124.1 membrane-associated tyrosine and threonine-specific cdc2-inhibitory kinase-like 1 [Homarus americanus]